VVRGPGAQNWAKIEINAGKLNVSLRLDINLLGQSAVQSHLTNRNKLSSLQINRKTKNPCILTYVVSAFK